MFTWEGFTLCLTAVSLCLTAGVAYMAYKQHQRFMLYDYYLRLGLKSWFASTFVVATVTPLVLYVKSWIRREIHSNTPTPVVHTTNCNHKCNHPVVQPSPPVGLQILHALAPIALSFLNLAVTRLPQAKPTITPVNAPVPQPVLPAPQPIPVNASVPQPVLPAPQPVLPAPQPVLPAPQPVLPAPQPVPTGVAVPQSKVTVEDPKCQVVGQLCPKQTDQSMETVNMAIILMAQQQQHLVAEIAKIAQHLTKSDEKSEIIAPMCRVANEGVKSKPEKPGKQQGVPSASQINPNIPALTSNI